MVSSTDAAAVFATLRFTHIRRKLARTLEAESGGNDPMAVALTLGLIAWVERPHSYGFDDLTLLVFRQIGLGLVVGVALGAIAAWVFARIPPSIGAFAPVASIAAAALSFGAADVIGGSGFLAVYLVGLAVGSTPSRYRRHLVAFHEGVAFVAQVALFVVLGLLVFPKDLRTLQSPACARVAADAPRPARRRLGLDSRERLHAPRTAAARLGRTSRRGADRPCDLRSVVRRATQGDDLQRRLLRRPRLDDRSGNHPRVGRAPARADLAGTAGARGPPRSRAAVGKLDLVDFAVAGDHAVNGSAVRELGLPRDSLIAVINRDGESIPPRGSTVVQAGDRLFVLVPRKVRADLEDVFSRWRRRV